MNDVILEIGEGWKPLVKDLYDEMRKYVLSNSSIYHLRIEQIKEKFGELRVYFSLELLDDKSTAYEDLYKIVSKYEKKSRSICEECGKPGILRKDGWLKTLCDKHAQRRLFN